MPIPHRKRVRFGKNPLVEVVFQAQFNSLLEIEQELPVRFHTAVRDQFPVFNLSSFVEIPVGPVQGPASPSAMRHYEMGSVDGRWKIALTSTFLALATTVYDSWDEFRKNAHFALDGFFGSYRPAFFSRVGLRYRDLISRDSLGLKDVPWRDLISPHISGVLGADGLDEGELIGMRGVFALSLRDDLHVQVQHGIVEGPTGGRDYVIDSDYFTEPMVEATTDATIEALDGFRPYPNDLFQWSISDRLRDAMEPVEQDG